VIAAEPAADGPPAEPVVPAEPPPPAAPAPQLCPHCQAPRQGTQEYCDDCGWIFPSAPAEAAPPAAAPAPTVTRINERYELCELIIQHGDFCRFRGRGFLSDTPEPLPLVILRAPAAQPAEAVATNDDLPPTEVEDAIGEVPTPRPEEAATAPLPSDALPPESVWPSIAWEHAVLERAQHPSLPRVLDRFVAGEFEYLVEEVPAGWVLWDAWDDPDATMADRFTWLRQVTEAVQDLHQAGTLLEALRPDGIVVTPTGQARLTDLSELLPLPLPPGAPIRATPYTAPELVAAPERADARANLYSIGALIYALHLGRELTDVDFEGPGTPKEFIPLFPDVHPLLGRLVSKTFCREPDRRFPTDEALREDPTGFSELIRALEVCRRSLDNVRLEIAAWTTTGMLRSGNEDAFALLHSTAGRQDDLGESALVLLADGMGGYEAGEVAAALAIEGLRRGLLQQRMFASLGPEVLYGGDGTPFDVEQCQRLLANALRDANKLVWSAARGGIGKRGMGCTAEAVYVNGRHVVVGHVGDSRTYHLHQGRLIQLTRDQTLVNRLVELGSLTPEEAQTHPRRSELQQAIGGFSDVDPAVYHGTLRPGDWVVVCSDGVSNHVAPDTLKEMLQTTTSAEMAARRLVNLVNLEGATDNATVVVIRAT
jgi:protein phosphatase